MSIGSKRGSRGDKGRFTQDTLTSLRRRQIRRAGFRTNVTGGNGVKTELHVLRKGQ